MAFSTYNSPTTTVIKTWIGRTERVFTLPVVPANQEEAWVLDGFRSVYNLMVGVGYGDSGAYGDGAYGGDLV